MSIASNTKGEGDSRLLMSVGAVVIRKVMGSLGIHLGGYELLRHYDAVVSNLIPEIVASSSISRSPDSYTPWQPSQPSCRTSGFFCLSYSYSDE